MNKLLLAVVMLMSCFIINLHAGLVEVDVTDSPYFADLTGADDSADSIQLALDNAISNNKPVHFPAGNYIVSKALVIPSTNSYLFYRHLNIYGDGTGLTEIAQITANKNLFEIGDMSGFTNSWTIKDMTVGTVEGSGSAFFMIYCDRGIMENVHIPAAGNCGIVLVGSLMNTFKNVFVSINLLDHPVAGIGNGIFDNGITLNGDCNANIFIGGGVEGGSSNQVVVDATSIGNTFTGCVFESNSAGSGILFSNGGYNTVIGCWFENNPQYAIYSYGGVGNRIIGCFIGAGTVYVESTIGFFMHGTMFKTLRLLATVQADIRGCTMNNAGGSVANYGQRTRLENIITNTGVQVYP